MLDNENNLILKVLSDYCNNRDTEFDLESIDIPKLYQICYEQNLDSLVYLQIRKVLDSINRKYKFFQSLMSDVFCDVNRRIHIIHGRKKDPLHLYERICLQRLLSHPCSQIHG